MQHYVWKVKNYIIVIQKKEEIKQLFHLRTLRITQSTITEKMAAVHFLCNALRSKIFKKANGCLLKHRRKAVGRFVYSAKISHH